jgi:hypothetical protein
MKPKSPRWKRALFWASFVPMLIVLIITLFPLKGLAVLFDWINDRTMDLTDRWEMWCFEDKDPIWKVRK